ncbi:hypothetical protein IJ579_01340 [bacterium]|nr:hypothetical protein [bacterium]
MDYRFEDIKIIDFIKTLAVYKGVSLRKLVAKIAEIKNSSDCYSNFYSKLKKETIKFSEISDIAEILGYEIIFRDKGKSA